MIADYFTRHLQVLFATLGQLAKSPSSTLMSIGVVAITLALPTLLFILIGNAENLVQSWEGRPQMTAFMARDTTEQSALELLERVQVLEGIAQVELITSEQALEEFRLLSGLGEVLDELDSNPLPTSLLILPDRGYESTAALNSLVDVIGADPGVEQVVLDLEWIKRFNSILMLLTRCVYVIGALLALAVVLVISNTIRLAILNRRDEIEIIKLIGGTNQFIQRPFLYNGFLLGLAGAIIAWLVNLLTLGLLQEPVAQLTLLYGSGFSTSGLSPAQFGLLIATGSGLGWLAARWSVSRHLRDIEPK
jgi:cell division transport system permease protein